MPDGMHKSAEGCETNPTYIVAKKAKHLEDSKTTPKSCLDAVFTLLGTKEVELIQTMNSVSLNTPSRQDFGVVSLSSRCFSFFAAIYVGFIS